MAYVIGLLTAEEREELERRGWDVEEPPPGFGTQVPRGQSFGMIYVDTNMFTIMNGPDWDKGPPRKEGASELSGVG